eukprot:435083_1
MKDASTWTVRELKRYLQTNGINTRSYKQKGELIDLASPLLYEDEKKEWIKNAITLSVICITVLLLNVYIRPKLEKFFWLNPKWVLSWLILHLIYVLEKLLLINVILSWVLPVTLKQYNIIDKYLVKQFQLFPIAVPLNYDTQTQNASMWIDLYPMILIYLLRKLKEHITMYYHYHWYDQYRETYYQQINNHLTDENSIENENEYEQQQDNENYDYDYDMDTIPFMDVQDDDDEFNEELQQALLESMEDNNANET